MITLAIFPDGTVFDLGGADDVDARQLDALRDLRDDWKAANSYYVKIT
jgi:hypothetical protein